MPRGILAVLTGLAITSGLVYGLDVLLARTLPDEFNERHPAYLAALLVFNVLVFVASGVVTSLIARRAEVVLSLTIGVLTVLIGIPGGMHVYGNLPAWWHVLLLVAAVPATLTGGASVAIARLPKDP